jgi:hypothetical protein
VALTHLQSNVEYGVATFATEQLDALIKKFGILAVHVDSDHELYVLCEHPVLKEMAWYTIPDLMDDGAEVPTTKLSVVKPN